MARTTHLLKDEQWQKIEPLLPSTAPGKKGGPSWKDNHEVLEGILGFSKPARAGVICRIYVRVLPSAGAD